MTVSAACVLVTFWSILNSARGRRTKQLKHIGVLTIPNLKSVSEVFILFTVAFALAQNSNSEGT